MLDRVRHLPVKWFVIGILAGALLGYLLGSGAIDLAALLPF